MTRPSKGHPYRTAPPARMAPARRRRDLDGLGSALFVVLVCLARIALDVRVGALSLDGILAIQLALLVALLSWRARR